MRDSTSKENFAIRYGLLKLSFRQPSYVDAVGFGPVQNLQVPRSSRKLSALLGMVSEGAHPDGEIVPNFRIAEPEWCRIALAC